jgi:iron-sulfur cluster repair protein YtfE (RIC family)
MNQNENNSEKLSDAVSLLEAQHDIILVPLTSLEKLSLDLDQIIGDTRSFMKVGDLVDTLSFALSKYFIVEEDYLFPELEKVLPDQSSTSAMKYEHSILINLCSKIKEQIMTYNSPSFKLEDLQSSIIALCDVLQRHLHKKNHMLIYEAQMLLSKEALDWIYVKIKDKLA